MDYFTSGRFAKICSVTKKALYHYEKIGLLKPALIRENGYRYYTLEQADRVATIRLLECLGSSLDEIRAFFALTSLAEKDAYLHEQQARVKEKLELFQKMGENLHFLDQKLHDYQKLGEGEAGHEQLPAEYYYDTAFQHNVILNPTTSGIKYGALVDDFAKPDKISRFFKATDPESSNYVKLAGHYVYFYQTLTNDGIPAYGAKALTILQQQAKIVPPIYQEDFSSAVLNQDDLIIMKFSALVADLSGPLLP